MNLDDYSDISPLVGEKAIEGVKILQDNPRYIANFVGILLDNKAPDYKEQVLSLTNEIAKSLDDVKSYDDFQKIITSGYLIPTLLKRSVTSLTF